MDKLKGIVDKVLALCCIFLCGCLVVVVTWQVFARFVLKNPSAFTEELAKILFVWFVLFAAAFIFGERGHMNIGFVVDHIPVKIRSVVMVLGDLSILAFAIFVLIMGGWSAVKAGMSQTNAAMTFITNGQIYAALPICGIFTSLYCLYNVYDDIMQLLRTKKEMN